MTVSLIVAIIWVLVISFVGMLLGPQHKRFGFPMLALFSFVLVYLAWDTGIFLALGLFVAALSIYRYPARYYGLAMSRKLTGKSATPKT